MQWEVSVTFTEKTLAYVQDSFCASFSKPKGSGIHLCCLCDREQIISASKYDITIPSEANISHIHVTQLHWVTINPTKGWSNIFRNYIFKSKLLQLVRDPWT